MAGGQIKAPNASTQYRQCNKTLTRADKQTDRQAGGQTDAAPRRAVARWRSSVQFADVGGVLYNRSCNSSYGRSLSRPLAKFGFLFENNGLLQKLYKIDPSFAGATLQENALKYTVLKK